MEAKINKDDEYLGVPDWAKSACADMKKAGIITKDFTDNIPAYRLAVILKELGLLNNK